ncbi:hypothetical protein Salmuc_03239 [Salipiger mucosus DSM 16094]|uniref:Uncharacterized protein n=1 Tax=Salipiger mucosus DSM 16094 TaxID=1123237 RepID=S9S860_9RHOB|nr:hypothetical protein Salmuc_03239 [Salipiger mucosus DSM 16094]
MGPPRQRPRRSDGDDPVFLRGDRQRIPARAVRRAAAGGGSRDPRGGDAQRRRGRVGDGPGAGGRGARHGPRGAVAAGLRLAALHRQPRHDPARGAVAAREGCGQLPRRAVAAPRGAQRTGLGADRGRDAARRDLAHDRGRRGRGRHPRLARLRHRADGHGADAEHQGLRGGHRQLRRPSGAAGTRAAPRAAGPDAAQLPRAGRPAPGAWAAGFHPSRRGAGLAGARVGSRRLCQPAFGAQGAGAWRALACGRGTRGGGHRHAGSGDRGDRRPPDRGLRNGGAALGAFRTGLRGTGAGGAGRASGRRAGRAGCRGTGADRREDRRRGASRGVLAASSGRPVADRASGPWPNPGRHRGAPARAGRRGRRACCALGRAAGCGSRRPRVCQRRTCRAGRGRHGRALGAAARAGGRDADGSLRCAERGARRGAQTQGLCHRSARARSGAVGAAGAARRPEPWRGAHPGHDPDRRAARRRGRAALRQRPDRGGAGRASGSAAGASCRGRHAGAARRTAPVARGRARDGAQPLERHRNAARRGADHAGRLRAAGAGHARCRGAGLRGAAAHLRRSGRSREPRRACPARDGRAARHGGGALHPPVGRPHGRRAGHSQGGRRLPAARPGLSRRPVAPLHRRQRLPGDRHPVRAEGRFARPCRRTAGDRRGPAPRSGAGCHARPGQRAGGPCLSHLHQRLDRHAQGGDGRTPQRGEFLHRHGRAGAARSAGHMAGRHQPELRHLGAGAVLDHGARVQGGADLGRGPRADLARADADVGSRHGLLALLLGQRRRGWARQVRAAARRREIRRQPRLFGGLDARAALSRLRRALSQSLGHRRGGRGGDAQHRRALGIGRGAAAPSRPDRRGMGGDRQPHQRAGGVGHRLRLAARRLRPAPREHAAREQARDDREHRAGPPPLARRGGGFSAQGRLAARGGHAAASGLVGAAGLGHHRRQSRDLEGGRAARLQRADAPAGPIHRGGRREDPPVSRRAARGRARPGGLHRLADAAHLPCRDARGGPRDRPRADEGLPALGRRAHQAVRLGLPGVQAAAGGEQPVRAGPRGARARRAGRDPRLRLRALFQRQRPFRHRRGCADADRAAQAHRRDRDRLPDRLRHRPGAGAGRAAPAGRGGDTRQCGAGTGRGRLLDCRADPAPRGDAHAVHACDGADDRHERRGALCPVEGAAPLPRGRAAARRAGRGVRPHHRRHGHQHVRADRDDDLVLDRGGAGR